MALDLKEWLLDRCSSFGFDVTAVFHRRGSHDWPIALSAEDAAQLEELLTGAGHLLPLPKEPAALANIIEVSVVDYMLKAASDQDGLVAVRGTERGYPDIELSGLALGNTHWAVDIKAARRDDTKQQLHTQSRITLYTGNTFFRFPDVHWPGNFRPFNAYAGHLDVIAIYTLNTEVARRVDNLRLIVQEPWRIASKLRSSTTREYIGAVNLIADIEAGHGDFKSADAFYRFWRAYDFRLSKQVQRILDRLRRDQSQLIERQLRELEDLRREHRQG